MHPSYSPLFTLGLLAERRAGSSSPHSTVSQSTHTSSKPNSVVALDDDHASAFYLTLQPPRRNAPDFLDLADSNRFIPTHGRKASNSSKSTSWTCTSHVTSPLPLSPIQSPPMTLIPPLPSPVTLRRSSRESLRHIPSPKPAPNSVTLPEPPVSFDHAPNSSLPFKTLPSPTNTSFSTPLIPPIVSLTKSSSLCSLSINSHERRKSRLYALACLEGRSRVESRISRSNPRKNFMSMSDDEDEESKALSASLNAPSIQVEDFGSFADIEDEADTIILTPSRLSPKQATFPRSSSHPAKRKRRSTIDSWFPLKSFIDLKDDDLSWNWRSFIEIGGVL